MVAYEYISNGKPGDDVLRKFHMGDPMPTKVYTVEELKAMGMVGFYRPVRPIEDFLSE